MKILILALLLLASCGTIKPGYDCKQELIEDRVYKYKFGCVEF